MLVVVIVGDGATASGGLAHFVFYCVYVLKFIWDFYCYFRYLKVSGLELGKIRPSGLIKGFVAYRLNY